MIYVAGLDLGQLKDYSALAIIEADSTPLVMNSDVGRFVIDGLPVAAMRCRHLERFPLQTRYADIATKVRDRLKVLKAECYLAVDKTGVGLGPFESLEAYGLNPIGITITGGNDVQAGATVRDWRVPKRDLVGTAQVALQNKVLTISSKLPMAEKLSHELLNFKMKITAEGHDTYNAWRENDHDDLVLAVAIAGWTAHQMIGLQMQIDVETIRQKENQARWATESVISPV